MQRTLFYPHYSCFLLQAILNSFSEIIICKKRNMFYICESIFCAKNNRRMNNISSTNEKSDNLHTAVSVALSIPSSVQREMENSVLMYSLRADQRVRRRSQRIDQKENRI